MKTTAGSVTDYCGNFIYADNQLITIFAGDVRVAPVNVGNSTYWKYEYSMKDHLGNVRVVFAAHSHGQPELLQQTSYYPFGMTLQQQNFNSQNATENKYLYNSKELQDDQLAGNTLDWYDYGARFYDATLGRWHVVDPHAENYYHASPFAYVENNPVIRIDPDGRDWYQDKKGNTMWQKGSAEVEEYKNIGASYTHDIGNGTSITYHQNEPTTIIENFLEAKDFKSQMTGNVNKNGTFEKKDGDEGNCNYQTRQMVATTGATMSGSGNDVANPVDYSISEAKNGRSVGLHVGVNSENASHWVASSSITTDIPTQKTTKIGFYDPAGRNASEGRGQVTIKGGQMQGGQERKDFKGYTVINVRKNNK